MSADFWIKKLNLQEHAEGGYFKEFYRSEDYFSVQPPYEDETRSASTSIYYLLKKNQFSAFHKIRSDEIWHYYAGDEITLYIIDEQGILSQEKLGNPLIHSSAARPQVLIKNGFWFAARIENGNDYCLLGCTVSPGFEYQDFVLAERKDLLINFPEYKEIIKSLTRNM